MNPIVANPLTRPTVTCRINLKAGLLGQKIIKAVENVILPPHFLVTKSFPYGDDNIDHTVGQTSLNANHHIIIGVDPDPVDQRDVGSFYIDHTAIYRAVTVSSFQWPDVDVEYKAYAQACQGHVRMFCSRLKVELETLSQPEQRIAPPEHPKGQPSKGRILGFD